MSPFEAGMLICFGISWPMSIAKSLRTKHVAGKSPLFMGIVAFGYALGILHKVFFNYDWILWLYVLNFAMVSFDLFLYFRYTAKARRDAAQP